jgi:hypothetical protein
MCDVFEVFVGMRCIRQVRLPYVFSVQRSAFIIPPQSCILVNEQTNDETK